jgi:hypothetical protein
MKLKQYVRYQMNFRGRWLMPAKVLMGLSFFLRIVYYFGLTTFADHSFGEVLFFMILPLLICGAFIVTMSSLKLNAPPAYGIIGGLMCLLLVIWSFFCGDTLRTVLAVLVYLASGAILVLTSMGYLPGKLLSSLLFAVPLACRILFYREGIALFDWCLEISVLTMLASLFCLTRCFKPLKRKVR